MFTIVASALAPLFLMVLAGAVAYRKEILPENTDLVLNGFVYYFTLPALLFYSLATTPFAEIARLKFIGGYLSAMLLTYWLMYFFSAYIFKSHYTESGIRATTASFPNSAYLGIPIMLYLFKGDRTALIATTLAIILPTFVIISVVAKFELHRADQSKSSLQTVGLIAFSMLKTPLIAAAFLGAVYSALNWKLPEFAVSGLRAFGMASVPCALFAIGGLIAKQKMELALSRICAVNVFKLVLHPLVAAAMMLVFGVHGRMLLMGIVLSGMPSAALACILAQNYATCETETAASVLISMILYMPALLITLVVAESFGLRVG